MADSVDFEFDAQTLGGLKAHLSIKNCHPNRDIPEMMISVILTQISNDAQAPYARLSYVDAKGKSHIALNLKMFAYGDEEALGLAALLQAAGAAIEKEAPGWFKQPKEVVLVSEDRWPGPATMAALDARQRVKTTDTQV